MWVRWLGVAAVVAQSAGDARADDAAPPKPVPGACQKLPAAPEIKRCYTTEHGVATFTAEVSFGTTLLVRFDEPIRTWTGLTSRYFSEAKNDDNRGLTIRPKVASWRTSEVMQIRTETMAVTLRFVAVEKNPDAQIHIVRWDRRSRDAALEAERAAIRAEMEAWKKRQTAALAARARALANQRLVAELTASGTDLRAPRGTTRARRAHLVLVAPRRLRIGSERAVELTLQNRDDVYDIGDLRGWRVRGGTPHPLEGLSWKCQARRLRPNGRTTCWVSLGLDEPLGDGDRIRLEVTERRGDRSVALPKLDVR